VGRVDVISPVISAETGAWRRGARGERRTARALRKLIHAGWTVLHNVALDGSAWHNGHPLAQTLATVRGEAQQLATTLGVPVLPLLCVHDTKIPWDELYIDNVPIVTPTRMLALLRSLEAHLDPTGVMLLAEYARHHLHPAT
jgi:hypothetical protein